METLNFLASLFGLFLIALPLSFLVHPEKLRKVFRWVEDEATMFFLGIATFAIGSAVILTHNVWVREWRVVITILGWITFLKGVIILFMPEKISNFLRNMENSQWLQTALVLAVILGSVLIYFGFNT